MVSASSSLTNVPVPDDSTAAQEHPGPGQSAVPEDKTAGSETPKNLEDLLWEDDPENPRNWPFSKKWATAAIVGGPRLFDASMLNRSVVQVSLYTFVSPLTSSIMAPGLPDIAIKYHITNETLIAMTLSIFLISFGVAVSRPQCNATRKQVELLSSPCFWHRSRFVAFSVIYKGVQTYNST